MPKHKTDRKPPTCFEAREASAETLEDLSRIQSEYAATQSDLDEFAPIRGVDVEGLDDPIVQKLPIYILEDITLYVEHRLKPDGFVYAMLQGYIELARTLALGDDDEHMLGLSFWIAAYAPANSYGSREAVSSWLGGAS